MLLLRIGNLGRETAEGCGRGLLHATRGERQVLTDGGERQIVALPRELDRVVAAMV